MLVHIESDTTLEMSRMGALVPLDVPEELSVLGGASTDQTFSSRGRRIHHRTMARDTPRATTALTILEATMTTGKSESPSPSGSSGSPAGGVSSTDSSGSLHSSDARSASIRDWRHCCPDPPLGSMYESNVYAMKSCKGPEQSIETSVLAARTPMIVSTDSKQGTPPSSVNGQNLSRPIVLSVVIILVRAWAPSSAPEGPISSSQLASPLCVRKKGNITHPCMWWIPAHRAHMWPLRLENASHELPGSSNSRFRFAVEYLA
mmetsp:Transcript_22008/g.74803  ORF Transcript_22008/g.74803 Transcript_22008/m.74803 type:complete len:261 (+) Transcript_22008:1283-2065(+)